MELSFLEPLYALRGPWASVHLGGSRADGDPGTAIAPRWRRLRDDLAAQGADPPTLDALDAAVRTDGGPYGQALFAAHGRLALAEPLPEHPARDTARFTDLPDVAPLALGRAPDIPYLAIVLGRGADGDEVTLVLQAGRWPRSRPAPAPRTTRVFPAAAWRKAAPEAVRSLEEGAERVGAEVVVLARPPDDAWASGVLAEHLPTHLRNRVLTLDAHAAPPAAGVLLEREVGRALAGRLSAPDEALLDRYLAQRARDPSAGDGVAAAVEALGRGQAGALLLDPGAAPGGPVWVGPEPTHLGLSEDDVRALGVSSPRRERADSALLRAAAAVGADLVVPPRGRVALDQGVGVLLRMHALRQRQDVSGFGTTTA